MRAFARHMTKRMKAVAAAGAVAAFWLAVWAFAAALVAQPLILPGPGAVVVALLRLVCDANTWAILVGSGARILGGLALAAICGGVLAGVSVRSRTFARAREHCSSLFDGTAGRVFFAGRGFGTSG